MFPTIVFAQELIVNKIGTSRKRFSATFGTTPPHVGEIYTWKDDLEQDCRAKVQSVKAIAILELTDCTSKEELHVGVKFIFSSVPTLTSDADLNKPDKPKSQGKDEKKIEARIDRTGLALVYSLADKINGNVANNAGNGSASFTLNATPSYGLGFYYHRLRRGSLGFSGTFVYEFSRDINSNTIAGVTANFLNKATLSIMVLTASANFAITDEGYFYLGANYPIIGVKSDTISVSSDVGYQVGGGYIFDNNLGLDVQMRFIRARGSYNNGTSSASITDGKLDGAVLSFAYYFN